MSMREDTMRAVLTWTIAIFVLCVFASAVYVDFLAFREKFPTAAWWAWLFSHR